MSGNSKIKDQLTVEILRELIRYEPETGKFFWKERPRHYFDTEARCRFWNRRFANKETMTADRNSGYKQGTILNGNYKAHQIAWFYSHGNWAEGIDHINGIPSDNRLENLREARQEVNNKNQRLSPHNKTGIPGVYWDNNRDKWAAKLSLNNRSKALGRFDDFFEACCARKSAEIKYDFHENHGRR